ncbi:hypothetical protein K0M31_010315 [Melipona bicolor]|uniref:Uncharacterized protein n=1 Tax=Melipona bicolor TaxID=60889 RepID=A0AA40FLR0_9HYME|nr:hypothetical protein K0M31_010315 [Melipona bicolor]
MNDCTQPENAITRVVKKEVKKKVRKLRGRSDSDTDDDEFEDDLVRDGKRDLLFSRSESLRCENKARVSDREKRNGTERKASLLH